MEIQITEQFIEVYNLSIDIDVIINGQTFNVYGHINLDDYEGEMHIVETDSYGLRSIGEGSNVELSEWCLRHGHDYKELKDYIINNIELPKNDSHDHESNSLSPDRPYIRYKTSVLEQMLEECNETYEMYKISKELELREYKGEIYNTKPYHLRKDIGSPNTRN